VFSTRAISLLVAAATAGALLTSGAGLALARGSAGPTRGASAQEALATTTCSPGASACPIRITFATGAYSAQAHSTLAGVRSAKWFVVHLRAGQAVIVIVEGAGPTRGTVYFPNGQSQGQPGGRVLDQSVPVAGDYRIRVSESPMGSAWSGRVDVLVVAYD
jgi:hypothetical protein